jgi:hypothetical protein
VEPTKRRGTYTETFGPAQEAECLRWIGEQNARNNVYFHVNPTRGPLKNKAAKGDIAALAWLHVDVDPRAGENLQAEQKRILGLFAANLPKGIPEPTCVVFSGGGFQAFWRLAEPMRLDDPALCDKAELYNMQLELVFGGDHCWNIDRIMRVPGTINWPDERKAKKGRVPTLAETVYFYETVYPLAAFTPAAPVQSREEKGFSGGKTAPKPAASLGPVTRLASLDELGSGVPDYCKVVINQGRDPDNLSKYPSRSDAVWYVACELVRCQVKDEVIFSILTDPNFAISAHILDQRNPEKSAQRQIARAHEFAIHPKLRELNEKHAIVEDVGGKCRIIGEVMDTVGLGLRTRLSFQSAADFKLRYMNQRIEIPTATGSTVKVELGEWWLRHPLRRQYDTIVFAPEQDVNGSYNLWKGFAYDARPGSCDLFLTHVRENVCAGNEEHYRYLLGWMASAVQSPASPGHTAVVMRGKQGTGKGVFAKTFGKLFGRHFMQVSDPKHLVGSFNAHLRDCVVLFGDEAFYAGDKKHESILKTLVTEEMVTIEAKGVDAVSSPNYVHLVMASNAEWVVPAGANERRFFLLDVAPTHLQDSTYFFNIQKELDAGGYEALLFMLRTYDLKSFNIRALPKTKGLMDQKMHSFVGEQDWWYQKLFRGELLPGKMWPQYVFSHEMTEDYAAHIKRFANTSRGNSTRLGMFLRSVLPPGWNLPGRLGGVHDVKIDGKKEKVDRPHIYQFPELDTCRKIWDDQQGGPFPWPKIDEVKPRQRTRKQEEADNPF